MRRAALVVYWLFGPLAIAAGLAAITSPGLILGAQAQGGLAPHLIREQGALFVFVGLMCFWCVRHFEQRRPVHLSLLVSTTLFALIHWLPVFTSGEYAGPAVVNTLPVVILAATAPWSRGAV